MRVSWGEGGRGRRPDDALLWAGLESAAKVEGLEELRVFHRRAAGEARSSDVTLVTQLSVDRLASLGRQLINWPSFISAAILITDAEQQLPVVEAWWLQEPAASQRLDLHILQWDPSTLTGGSPTSDPQRYPINFLRNTAMLAARTEVVLLLDVDFVPFTNRLAGLEGAVERLVREGKSAKRVYVVPAFEWSQHSSKDLLMDAVVRRASEIRASHQVGKAWGAGKPGIRRLAQASWPVSVASSHRNLSAAHSKEEVELSASPAHLSREGWRHGDEGELHWAISRHTAISSAQDRRGAGNGSWAVWNRNYFRGDSEGGARERRRLLGGSVGRGSAHDWIEGSGRPWRRGGLTDEKEALVALVKEVGGVRRCACVDSCVTCDI